jgi:hypothetical protein
MRRAGSGLCSLLLLALLAPSAHAQPANKARCSSQTPITGADDLRVLASCSEKEGHFTTTTVDTTGRIYVLVRGLAEYQALYAKQKNPDPRLDPSAMILYVDGHPLPRFVGQLPDPGYSHLMFDLRDLARKAHDHTDSLSAWKQILSSGIRGQEVKLSVGFETRGPLASDVTDFRIDPISGGWLTVWIILAAALLALLLWAGSSSDMLRVPGAPPAKVAEKVVRKAHSLARWQMAAWFFVVLVAWAFIYLVTGALDALSATVLGLMGISAATGLAATVVDTAGSKPGDPAPATTGLAEDLLSEGDGMSLPRLQMAAWTIVLLLVFVRAVYDTLSMPDFNPTLLGLMGISGGAYVGFKTPDKKAATTNTTKTD